MLRRSVFTGIVLFSLIPSLCVARAGEWVTNKATRSLQLSYGGYGMRGEFSPDGTTIAYVALSKHFTPGGRDYFRAHVRVWDGGADSALAELPDTDPAVVPANAHHYLDGDGNTIAWLPSGEYIWVCPHLVRVADGQTTKAGREGKWFVLNDAWALSPKDAVALNEFLRGGYLPSAMGGTRGWTPRHLLPAVVPECSANWYYDDFQRCPADQALALYIGYDRHFDGCVCCKGAQRTYLGVAHLGTGRLKRLTFGGGHRIPAYGVRWSPDGRWISYYREALAGAETYPAWCELHVVRPDGSADLRLASGCSGGGYRWLSPSRIVVPLYGNGHPPDHLGAPWNPTQLAVVTIPDQTTTVVTKGPYVHSVCSASDDRILVRECDLSGHTLKGNLYVIEPL